LLGGCGEKTTTGSDDGALGPAAVISLDPTSALAGDSVTIQLRLEFAPDGRERTGRLGGFDFRIHYDKPVLAFESAVQGKVISGWQYFSVRTHHVGLCDTCEEGQIRVVGIMDVNDGVFPDPYQPYPEGVLATLTFTASDSAKFAGRYHNVYFCTADCRDNSMTAKNGNHVLIADPNYENGEQGAITDTITCPPLGAGWYRPVRGFHSGSVFIDAIRSVLSRQNTSTRGAK
jgi:hypothetical protein